MLAIWRDVQWPPSSLDISYVPYDVESAMSTVKDSLSLSLKSIGSMGFRIIGILMVIGLISVLFRVLVIDRLKFLDAIDNREFKRKVKAGDIKRNYDSIIDERMRDLELGAESRRLFHDRSLESVLNDKARDLEMNFQARSKYRHLHFKDDVSERVYHKTVNIEATRNLSGLDYESERNNYYNDREQKLLSG